MEQTEEDVSRARAAIQRALWRRHWGFKDLTRNPRATQRLVEGLSAHCNIPEVAKFLRKVKSNPKRIDSREQHYIQRRYLDELYFQDQEDMDRLCDRILEDSSALIYRKGGIRYQIRSSKLDWICILEPDGTRVSLYPDLNDDFGDPLWSLGTLTG